jgi:hypothetical protein
MLDMRLPRPLKTRKSVRWVRLADIPQDIRTSAAHQWIKHDMELTPEGRIELLLLATEPGEAGGWVAV